MRTQIILTGRAGAAPSVCHPTCLALIMAVCCFVRVAIAQDVVEPVEGQPIYYWNGDMQVDLILALDELGLEANPGEVIDAANLPRIAPEVISATLSEDRPHFAYLRVARANNEAELAATAGAILKRSARGVSAPLPIRRRRNPVT